MQLRPSRFAPYFVALAASLSLAAGPAHAADACFEIDATKAAKCASGCTKVVADAGACGVEIITDAAKCAAASLSPQPDTACGTVTKRDAACGTEVVKSTLCGVTHYSKDAEACGRKALSAAEKAVKCVACGFCKLDPKCDCECEGPALSCDVPKRCELPKSCELPKTCCQKPKTCAVATECDPVECGKRLVKSVADVVVPFDRDGKLTDAARCVLTSAIRSAYADDLERIKRAKAVRAAMHTLEQDVLAPSRDAFRASAREASAAHADAVKRQVDALRKLLKSPAEAARVWLVLGKVARKEIDAELLAQVRVLATKLGVFGASAGTPAAAHVAPSTAKGVAAGAASPPPAGPWPQAWGLSLAGNLGLGMGADVSFGFAVDPGMSVIVGTEQLGGGIGIVGAELGLLVETYPQAPLDLDGPQVAIGAGAAYGVGAGFAFSWSFCMPTLQPTLHQELPHTSSTCDGAQVQIPKTGTIRIIPEPAVAAGVQTGFDVSVDGTVGYGFELGAAGAVPPGY